MLRWRPAQTIHCPSHRTTSSTTGLTIRLTHLPVVYADCSHCPRVVDYSVETHLGFIPIGGPKVHAKLVTMPSLLPENRVGRRGGGLLRLLPPGLRRQGLELLNVI